MASERRSSSRISGKTKKSDSAYTKFQKQNRTWHSKIEKSVDRLGRNGDAKKT